MMSVLILETVADVKKFVHNAKAKKLTIGLVPTMGALHDGHITLMKRAKETCDIVIASVFVNPTQFGPNEDFDAYPRTFGEDCAKLTAVGVDAVFHPSVEELYPIGYSTFITVDGGITDKLCGAKRPGHFRGVATVVTKLINITEADKAFFGQKDAQQVVVIKRFVSDLNLNIDIEMVPIVRDNNGLALSSRNKYLSAEEKRSALVLSRSLKAVAELIADGEKQVEVIKARLIEKIKAEPLSDIDYVEIYSFPELKEISLINEPVLIAVAVRFGTTRLIDNIIVGGK